MFGDLIIELDPPSNRCGKCTGGKERHLTEAAVMLAYDQQVIMVSSVPGLGDVVARAPGLAILAECKGGIVNTKHAGQTSRLRKGLCEAVGLLMASPKAGRQVAVVPKTETTVRLAQRLAPRAKEAGIEIALVDELGQVVDITP